MMSGFTYTLEKGFYLLSTSTIKAGFLSGENTGEVPEVETIGFFNNLFVPVFLVMGIIFYGFSKSEKNK